MSQSEVIMLLLWSVWLVPLASGSSMYNPRTATPMSSSLACENSLMGLDCERKSGIIRITRANYGRFSLTTCNSIGATSEWNVSCRLPESKRIVAERCDGHPKCEIMASNEVFGDPCVGTFKYLQVYYTCEPIVYTLPPLTTTEIPTTTTEVITTTTKATTTNLPQRQVCDAIYFEGRNWPYTKVGEVAFMSCSLPRVGRITWRCTGNGWKGEKPDDSNCQIPVTDSPVRTTPPRYCQSTESLGVMWPPIKVGEMVERPCPEGKHGMMSWRCTGAGWRGRFPDTSNCVSPWLNSIDQMVNSSSSSIEDVADQLKKQTGDVTLGAGDLKKMSDIITKMGQRFKIPGSVDKKEKREKLEKFSKSIAETGSNILSERQSSSWEELPENNKTQVAASFLVSMETTGFNIADNLEEEEDSIVSSNENLFMEVSAVKVTRDKPAVTYPSSDNQKWRDDQITIPMEDIEALSEGGVTKVVVFVYQNMDELMTTKHNTSFINSNILSASIMSANSISLRKPVTFTLRLFQAFNKSVIPTCAYWDFRESGWSRAGCWRMNFNQSHATCQCSHLTNFAVLMDVAGTGNMLSDEHQFALMTITFLGCIISIICLLMSFITFSYFRNLQCDRNTIHKNLVLSLMLAEILFVIGISLVQNRILCGVVAGLLHFLFLAAFAWMCLEGFQLYVMLIEVFEGERSRRKWYYLFGYGIPLVTVAVTAGVKPSGYGTDKHCWLDTSSSVIWSFVGPTLAVILFNIVMLSIAVYMMHKHANTLALAKGRSKFSSGILRDSHSGTSQSTAMSDEKARTTRQIPSWVKGAAILVVLLGLTWVFGVLFISQETVVMAYVFTALNSFQGLFIFVFHCLMNEKVKKEYKKFAYKSTWLPECVRAYCIGYTSPSNSNTPNHSSSSSGGYLLKLWSGRKRRKSSSSTLDKSSKGKKRISEPRSDSSVFTSHDLNTPIIRHSSSNSRKVPKETNGYLEPNQHEYEAILGDLSEVNCSVIDSEYVSEYCHKELQVSRETNGYSSESDNDEGHDQFEKNRLSILSEDSAVKNESEFGVSQQNITETEFLLEKTVSEKNLLNRTQDETSRINCDSLGKKLYPGSFSEIHGYLSDGEELNHSMPLIPAPCPPEGRPSSTKGSQTSLPRLHIVEETLPGDKNNNSSDC